MAIDGISSLPQDVLDEIARATDNQESIYISVIFNNYIQELQLYCSADIRNDKTIDLKGLTVNDKSFRLINTLSDRFNRSINIRFNRYDEDEKLNEIKSQEFIHRNVNIITRPSFRSDMHEFIGEMHIYGENQYICFRILQEMIAYGKHIRLHTIVLKVHDIQEEEMHILAQFIRNSNAKLRTLKIKQCEVDQTDGLRILIASFKESKYFSCLQLSDVPVQESITLEIFKAFREQHRSYPGIQQSLILEKVLFDVSSVDIDEYNYYNSSLSHIRLKGCMWRGSSRAIHWLSRFCTDPQNNIQRLELPNNGLSNADLELLSESIENRYCKLKALDLSNNAFSMEGIQVLSNALKSPFCQLKELNLSNNNLQLDLAFCMMEILTSENCKLTSLDLSGNKIGDEGVFLICEGLNHPNSLMQELILSNNEMTIIGLEYLIVSVTQKHTQLYTLGLESNFLDEASLSAFEKALVHPHNRLQLIYLANNVIEDGIEAGFNEKHPKCRVFITQRKNEISKNSEY